MALHSPILCYVTAQNTPYRLTRQPDLSPGELTGPSLASVVVDPRIIYQTIEGFGGAFTEAAALTFCKLSEERQQEILRAYFDPVDGLGYSLGRTHINSCDFCVGHYAYDEVAGDVELKHFSIEHDRPALIPLIKAAQRVASGPIRLVASPWSPPAWMKTNGDMCNGGKLRPEYRAVWAAYCCRYIREYEREGIAAWGLTLQNEPLAAQTWESCIYTPEEARDLVRDYLGPALAQNNLSDVRLLIWDHNRDLLYEWIKPILDDPAAARYVWGVAFHWYVEDKFDNLQYAHDAYPDKKLLFTEGCQEGGTHIGDWLVGERYGHSLMNDLNHWAVGWIDWNLVLDETGGPNHAGNFCSAPIIADTRVGVLHYQSSYYYIGHFARFVRPGARRILCATSRDALQASAFLNPDGKIAVVVLNLTGETVPFALKLDRAAAMTESLAHSISTYVFDTQASSV